MYYDPAAPLYCAQDIEFTVENKVLHVLQASNSRRTARAGVCVAVNMVKERLISEREALLRIDAEQMDFFLHAMVDKDFGEARAVGVDST
jgi:pyruvate,orthophosphate dikinase